MSKRRGSEDMGAESSGLHKIKYNFVLEEVSSDSEVIADGP